MSMGDDMDLKGPLCYGKCEKRQKEDKSLHSRWS